MDNAEVLASRKAHGANTLTKRKRRGFVRSFFANFGDPIFKILLIALAINCVFLFKHKNFLETFGIAVAILIAVLVSTISEQGSEAAFEKLQRAAADITVRVRRAGVTVQIPIEEVVVGDIVLLGAGDKIPADGIIVSGAIEVDQSVLNGESKEARKTPKDDNALFSGTVVTNGEAIMQVTSVGDKTIYGKLAAELQTAQPKSPLKLKLERLAKIISFVGYIGAALVAIAYIINLTVIKNEAFTFTHALNVATLVVSVIVMAVPEGLPLMVSVVLSSNMKHMIRDNVLVRKLNGIETAGSMNILFTDKTGTLTQGRLEVVEVYASDMQMLGAILRYCNSAVMSGKRAIGGNFTDRILLEYAQNLLYIEGFSVKETLPFNSANKYMSVTLTDGRTLLKGAPEVILEKCDCDKAAVMRKVNDLTAKAYRLIACAVDDRFVGLVAIRDQVRPEAAVAVKRLQSAGIQIVMITGDARETAVAVAREVGILTTPPHVVRHPSIEEGNSSITKAKVPLLYGGVAPRSGDGVVLTSHELSLMSDKDLEKVLTDLRVVARALPSDKSRLVRIAQNLGLVVGMTGDGVNDAPALKAADIGFAMGSGTEVAKEAGDIVIVDDNINSIAHATSYGRTIFKSIRKFLIFKLTINFVAMGISILAPFLGISTPITVLQMLWINLVMDTLAGLAYGGERPRQSYMQEKPKVRGEPIINRYMWGQIVYASIFIGAISLWFLISPMVQSGFGTHGVAYAMTAFFVFFMFINIFNSLNSRTHDINPISYLSLNKPFVWIMGIVTVAQIALVFFGGAIFRTEAISLRHFMFVVILAATIVPIDMLRKMYIKWRWGDKIVNT